MMDCGASLAPVCQVARTARKSRRRHMPTASSRCNQQTRGSGHGVTAVARHVQTEPWIPTGIPGIGSGATVIQVQVPLLLKLVLFYLQSGQGATPQPWSSSARDERAPESLFHNPCSSGTWHRLKAAIYTSMRFSRARKSVWRLLKQALHSAVAVSLASGY